MVMEPENEQEDLLFEHHRIVVDKGQTPLRIDKFLSQRLGGISRARIQSGIESGFVLVNETAIKPNHKVQPGETIVIALPVPPRDTEAKAENIPIEVIYEDAYLLVVNKQAGMVVHPAHLNWTGTLVNALLWRFEHLPELPGNHGRPGLVHRIDKDTSGLLVVAKEENTLTGLARQFFDHTIERVYWALAWGEPDPPEQTVDIPLGRSPKDRRVTVAFPAGEGGQHAVTHFQTIERLRYVSLLSCRLETGRTHQIRAHLAHIGHPIFGDSTYGGTHIRHGTITTRYKQFVHNCLELLPRQALHARTLGFIHPITGKSMHFDSPLPNDFEQVIEKWRGYVRHN